MPRTLRIKWREERLMSLTDAYNKFEAKKHLTPWLNLRAPLDERLRLKIIITLQHYGFNTTAPQPTFWYANS